MKQYTAIITSILFLFSCFNGYCAVAAGSSPNVSTNSFSVPKQFGFVSDSFILSNNNRLVILIQDLHNDKETQTNIKNIISDVDKNYGFDNIFIEGLYNNPVWLAKETSSKIADILFDKSYLSGAEYYTLLNDNLKKLLPLDDKEIYKSNIQRLAYLTLLEPDISSSISKLDKAIDSAKRKTYSSKNRKIDKLVSKYHNGKISQKAFYSSLGIYIDAADLSDMPNISDYYAFLKTKKINSKKLNKEISSLINELKKILPYSEYSQFISKISETASYGSEIKRISIKYNIDLKKYKEIENYIKADKVLNGLNLFVFIDEEKELIRELRIKHSKNKEEQLLIVLDDIYAYYRDFLSNKLTEYGYHYLNDFGIDNFVNLWASILKNKDIYDLAFLHKYFDEYNRSNIYRSRIFIKNILQARQSADGNIIAVMGGFHTREVAEYLKYNGISYAVITPSLADIGKDQNSLYKQNILRSIDIKYNAIPTESVLNEEDEQAELIGLENMFDEIAPLLERWAANGGRNPGNLKDLTEKQVLEKRKENAMILSEVYEIIQRGHNLLGDKKAGFQDILKKVNNTTISKIFEWMIKNTSFSKSNIGESWTIGEKGYGLRPLRYPDYITKVNENTIPGGTFSMALAQTRKAGDKNTVDRVIHVQEMVKTGNVLLFDSSKIIYDKLHKTSYAQIKDNPKNRDTLYENNLDKSSAEIMHSLFNLDTFNENLIIPLMLALNFHDYSRILRDDLKIDENYKFNDMTQPNFDDSNQHRITGAYMTKELLKKLDIDDFTIRVVELLIKKHDAFWNLYIDNRYWEIIDSDGKHSNSLRLNKSQDLGAVSLEEAIKILKEDNPEDKSIPDIKDIKSIKKVSNNNGTTKENFIADINQAVSDLMQLAAEQRIYIDEKVLKDNLIRMAGLVVTADVYASGDRYISNEYVGFMNDFIINSTTKQEKKLESELKRYTSYATEERRKSLETYLNESLSEFNKTKFTSSDFIGIDNFYDSQLDDGGVTISLKINSEIIKFRYDYQSKKLFFAFNSPNFTLDAKYTAVLDKLQKSADKVGFEIYPEGGLIRDSLLGIQPNDLDTAVRKKDGNINSDMTPLYEQLLKDFDISELKNLKTHNFGTEIIMSINFIIDGVEVSLINFKGFDEEGKHKDITVNGFYYNYKTNDILDVTNRGFFDVLDKKMVSAYVSGKDEYLKQFERKKPSTALSKIIRQIRLSVHTGFELPKEVKAILADKKLIEKMVDEHRARYYNDKSVKETRDENAWALLPFFRVENISAALKQLHKNNLLSALIPEIKNVSRKRINYMLKNISLAENTKNERFAALLTAFDREMALLVLNNFPKTLSGPIDEIVLEDKDINEIMKKYDDITTGSNIFKSKKAKEKKPNLNSSKITEQLENLSKTSEELNINNGDVKADFKPTPLARGFEKSLYDAKRQSLYPVIDEHKVDNKHLKHSMSSQSAYASLLSAS